MPRRNFTEEAKEYALKLLRESQLSLAEISRETGISDKNLIRWRKDLNGGGTKRRRRRAVVEEVDDTDYKTGYELEALKNAFLRRGLRAKSDTERYQLENQFQREVLKLLCGHELEPLFDVPEEATESVGSHDET